MLFLKITKRITKEHELLGLFVRRAHFHRAELNDRSAEHENCFFFIKTFLNSMSRIDISCLLLLSNGHLISGFSDVIAFQDVEPNVPRINSSN